MSIEAIKQSVELLEPYVKKTVSETNLFEILGLSGLETRHSNFISWLMDSRKGHNLKGFFLEKFVKSAPLKQETTENRKSVSRNSMNILKRH